MNTYLKATRGAINIEEDDSLLVQRAVKKMILAIMQYNDIPFKAFYKLHFTVTPDIRSYNPAKAIRMVYPSFNSIPMFCAQEPVFEESMPRCIRVLVEWWCPTETFIPVPVYLGDTPVLRPDLYPIHLQEVREQQFSTDVDAS